MYTKINIIEKTNGFHLVSGKLYTFINDIQKLCEFDDSGQLLWQTGRCDIYYRYHITPKQIIYYLDSSCKELFILEREEKQVLKVEKIDLNLSNRHCYFGDILYSFEDENIVIYDFQKLALTN